LKIFLDTNIFLDLILKRDGFEDALVILDNCNKNLFEGFVADITLLNIDYIASKQTKDLREFLTLINSSYNVVGADNKVFKLALNLKNNDLEDSVQYFCAKVSKCDVIITNDKNFYQGDIKTVSSKEFASQYL